MIFFFSQSLGLELLSFSETTFHYFSHSLPWWYREPDTAHKYNITEIPTLKTPLSDTKSAFQLSSSRFPTPPAILWFHQDLWFIGPTNFPMFLTDFVPSFPLSGNLTERSIIILIFIYHQFPCLLLDSLNLPGKKKKRKKHHLFNYNSSSSPHRHLWLLRGRWTTVWPDCTLNLWLQMISRSLELAIIPTILH